MKVKYREIVFLQYSEAEEYLKLIRGGHEENVLKSLIELYDDAFDEYTIHNNPPWGRTDRIYEHENYILSWNTHFDYVALTEMI